MPIRQRSRYSVPLEMALPPIMVWLFVLSVWEMVTDFYQVPSYLLPSPISIFFVVFSDPIYFLRQSGATFTEALLGVIIAVIGGFISGAVLLSVGNRAEKVILPFMVAIQAVPVVALAPLFTIWFGIGLLSKALLVAALCWFPMAVNTLRGLLSVNRDQLNLLRIFHATRWQVFSRLQLPMSVPFLVSGLKVSLSLSMIGAIVAEYSGAGAGLGYVITQSSYRLDTERLFAAIFCAAAGSLLLYGGLVLVENRFLGRFFRSSA